MRAQPLAVEEDSKDEGSGRTFAAHLRRLPDAQASSKVANLDTRVSAFLAEVTQWRTTRL